MTNNFGGVPAGKITWASPPDREAPPSPAARILPLGLTFLDGDILRGALARACADMASKMKARVSRETA